MKYTTEAARSATPYYDAYNQRKIAHTDCMRLTCIICTLNLIILGICGGVFAFSGVNILPYMFFGNLTAIRCFLAVCAVSALFEVYALIVFRPFRGLK